MNSIVQKKQIHQELSVELIIRRRSLEGVRPQQLVLKLHSPDTILLCSHAAFAARCKYFEPPLTDVDARKWWDAAAAGQHVE